MGTSLAIRPPSSWTVRSAKPSPPLNLLRHPSSALTPGPAAAAAAAAARTSRPFMSLRCSGGDNEGSSGGELVRTLLIDNYDSYTYNIYQELSVVNGVPPVVVHNNEWTWEYLCYYLYEEKAFDNIVISPGPGSPTCPKDIGICLKILLECMDIPILGVCLGHQALGLVHGAQIVHAPEPVHGRLSEIEHVGCNLFDDIPSGRKSGFKVVRYHSLVINEGSLPKELIPIAWTTSSSTQSFLETQESGLLVPSNSNDFGSKKILMGIMHSSRPHYGVQFHPESIATCHGRQIFKNFKKMTVDYGLISSLHHETKVHHSGNLNFEALERRARKYVWKENNIQSVQSVMSDYVSHAYQSSKELSKTGLYYSKAMRHQLAVWGNGTLPLKSVDDKYFRLNWKKIDCLVNHVGGPENIFFELFGDENAKDTFWLDSSSTDQGRARFSFMGGKGGPLWRYISFELSDRSNLTANVGGRLSIQDSRGSVKTTYLEGGFFDFLNKELQSFHYDEEDHKELPFDFCGGFVGFIGYNLKAECGALPNHHKSTTPDACLFFADNLVVIDHSNGDVYILSIQGNSLSGISWGVQECLKEKSWLRDTEKRLLKLKAMANKKLNTQKSRVGSPIPSKEGFVVDKSRHQYIRDVEECLKFITDGESYELCLTTQMRRRVGDINALNLYLHLRKKNPAPYAAWLNFARDDLCICSSSPERFLRLDRKEILEAKPIKGTIARGRTPEEDENLRLQLQYSEKDQAENLMIVDLLRNDLGRVCEPGSVCVPRLMDVESYATVHTMVSTIQGKKKSNSSPVDCVRASFPGGSMTGAPKLRSMEILDSLENCSRGIYSGSIGFFSYNQTFDLNIVIRTVVIHKGEASVGAGGAIVALSNPEDEYAEMMLKAKVPTRVVEECSKDLDRYDTTVKMAK